MYKICDWLLILFKCKQHSLFNPNAFLIGPRKNFHKMSLQYQILEISTLPASYKLLFAENFIVNVGLSELNDIYNQPIFISGKDNF